MAFDWFFLHKSRRVCLWNDWILKWVWHKFHLVVLLELLIISHHLHEQMAFALLSWSCRCFSQHFKGSLSGSASELRLKVHWPSSSIPHLLQVRVCILALHLMAPLQILFWAHKQVIRNVLLICSYTPADPWAEWYVDTISTLSLLQKEEFTNLSLYVLLYQTNCICFTSHENMMWV